MYTTHWFFIVVYIEMCGLKCCGLVDTSVVFILENSYRYSYDTDFADSKQLKHIRCSSVTSYA